MLGSCSASCSQENQHQQTNVSRDLHLISYTFDIFSGPEIEYPSRTTLIQIVVWWIINSSSKHTRKFNHWNAQWVTLDQILKLIDFYVNKPGFWIRRFETSCKHMHEYSRRHIFCFFCWLQISSHEWNKQRIFIVFLFMLSGHFSQRNKIHLILVLHRFVSSTGKPKGASS